MFVRFSNSSRTGLIQKVVRLLAIVFLVSLTIPVNLVAAKSTSSESAPDSNQALCLPGQIEQFNNSDCANLGPGGRLAELETLGITFPAEPLPIVSTPAELGVIPFGYAIVSNENVPLYSSPENAQANNPGNSLPASKIKYVSLYQKVKTELGTYYQIATYEWISGDYIKKVSVPTFRGFEVRSNPDNAFGWILETVSPRSRPEINAPKVNKTYYRYNVLPIYASQITNDEEWVMVGVNEWLQKRYIARVLPSYTPPAGVSGDRWIEINLQEQVLTVYEDGKLVFATLISSGSPPFYTQPGVFQVYKMLVNDRMSGAFEADRSDYYYLEDVPYILYYDNLRALHGAYWNNYLGYRGSHGCVNLSVADAHWLYEWAREGDYVYVWDPTGKTPTDPALYGAGGF